MYHEEPIEQESPQPAGVMEIMNEKLEKLLRKEPPIAHQGQVCQVYGISTKSETLQRQDDQSRTLTKGFESRVETILEQLLVGKIENEKAPTALSNKVDVS